MRQATNHVGDGDGDMHRHDDATYGGTHRPTFATEIGELLRRHSDSSACCELGEGWPPYFPSC